MFDLPKCSTYIPTPREPARARSSVSSCRANPQERNMGRTRGRSRAFRDATFPGKGRATRLVGGVIALVLAGAGPAVAAAQQSAPAAPALVFDGVTVVDVEQGKLLPARRVVIAGNRIQSVGAVRTVKLPPGAQV